MKRQLTRSSITKSRELLVALPWYALDEEEASDEAEECKQVVQVRWPPACSGPGRTLARPQAA